MKFKVTIQPIQGSEVTYRVGGFDRGDARSQGVDRWLSEDDSRIDSQIAEVFVEPLESEAQTEARLLGRPA